MGIELQNMLSGRFYNSRDAELLSINKKTKRLLHFFNSTLDSLQYLKQILGKCEESIWIEPPFYCDYGINIRIGKNTFINYDCVFLDSNLITIGKNCLIGPKVQLYTVSHPLRASERTLDSKVKNEAPYLTSSKPITIGDNVWIAGGSIILPGVSIGSNSTIGSGSVVTKDIEAGVLAYGNPCKVIKKL